MIKLEKVLSYGDYTKNNIGVLSEVFSYIKDLPVDHKYIMYDIHTYLKNNCNDETEVTVIRTNSTTELYKHFTKSEIYNLDIYHSDGIPFNHIYNKEDVNILADHITTSKIDNVISILIYSLSSEEKSNILKVNKIMEDYK